MNAEETIRELNGLVQTCKDGESGYSTAAADVQNTELESVFAEFAKQRAQFARSLQAEVERLGGQSEDSGSISGTLFRGWINLKSALSSGNGATIIAACETGELAALAAFDWVVNRNISGHTRVLVEQQCNAIKEAHAHLLRLRAEEATGAKFQRNDN